MKRTPEDDDEKALGRAARKARTEPDGRLAAAVELAIDTDDDLDPTETEVGAGVNDDDVDADVDKDAEDGRVVPQEALIRRRIRRMKELKRLYQDQYWRLLEDLRRRHYRFQLRHGHGGRKEEGAAAAQEREKAGLAAQCACDDCDAKPVPLSDYCFAHILKDPKQMLYAAGESDDEEAAAGGKGEAGVKAEDGEDAKKEGDGAKGDGAKGDGAKKAKEDETEAAPVVLKT